MFGMVIERVILTDLKNVTDTTERKIAAVGLSNILIDCKIMLETPYYSYYPQLLACLVEFFELPSNGTQFLEEEHDDDAASGYQAAYSQLIFAKNPRPDSLPGEFLYYSLFFLLQ